MARTLTLSCVHPGGSSCIVDGGRPGYRDRGMALGGPADYRARDAANRLLGQPLNTPCLEIALAGGQWFLSGRGQIVLTGADMNWRLNGRLLEPYQVHFLDGDYLLIGTAARRGLRCYLAANGNWDLQLLLGSVGGLSGTSAITPGWNTSIRWQQEAPFRMELDLDRHWPSSSFYLPVVPGPEWGWLSPVAQEHLIATVFLTSSGSNRQGIRLNAREWMNPRLPSLLSSPVLPGTIQLSPTGPILLGPDAQTIGGYPRPLLVTNAEALAASFQLEIGEAVQFFREEDQNS